MDVTCGSIQLAFFSDPLPTDEDPYESKWGGKALPLPDWKPVPVFTCKTCKKDLVLVTQVFSPFKESNRIFYVFSCSNLDCKAQQWKFLRGADIEQNPFSFEEPKPLSNLNLNPNVKSWAQIATSKEKPEEIIPEVAVDDWGAGVTDLANEWEAGEAPTVITSPIVKDEIKTTVSLTEDDWGAGDTDDWGAGDTDKLSEEIQKMLLKRNEQDEAPKKVSKQEKGVEQNKIETKQEQDIPKGIVSTSGLIVFIIRPEKKNKIVIDPNLPSYYMEWEKEPEPKSKVVKLSNKEKSLIKQFQNEIHGSGGGGEFLTEEYESAANKFLRSFHKVVDLSPEQCLRYGGSPIWVSKPDGSATIPRCPLCRSVYIFEFQLMPALIYLLTETKKDEISINYGIIAFFTCPKNCKSKNQNYFEEFFVLQEL